MEGLYAALSESAHPNYEGTCLGYSEVDTENHVTTFANNWYGMYSGNHIAGLELCMQLFFSEYNEEWPDAFEELEKWVEEHDDQLEATK
ncbi:hypothetical protein [Stutzerimonas nitrititolerans]|uniref:hypothetical protein n=1 Tax=Stutzerimonas nitrititolerans TaxID=2482751 RepID=UPI00289F446A|nr:hypothetical protein [Stutzerimonas nitrititolerans]